ncbi:MAG: sigma-70 family RNA polymerase sigma factor [Gemmataceae bacterium]
MNDQDRFRLGPLLQRVIEGDRVALNELLTQLRPYLHALVRQTLGPDWKDASDIVQSGLRRINENLDDLLDNDPTVPHLLAWIKKIVRNRAIDAARRRKPVYQAGEHTPLQDQPEQRSPQERAEREQRATALLAALQRLPEKQRLVVELHYFDRLRDDEIRARLGGSVAAIRVLRCRALKHLRHLLEADHASP